MSTKLVKKQLGSILAGAIENSQATSQQPSKAKRRQQKAKRKSKKVTERGPNKELVRRTNLQYFTQTSKPSSTTQDLLAQALRSRGAAAQAPPQDDEDFDDFGDEHLF